MQCSLGSALKVFRTQGQWEHLAGAVLEDIQEGALEEGFFRHSLGILFAGLLAVPSSLLAALALPSWRWESPCPLPALALSLVPGLSPALGPFSLLRVIV